jgi:hypothetical protein
MDVRACSRCCRACGAVHRRVGSGLGSASPASSTGSVGSSGSPSATPSGSAPPRTAEIICLLEADSCRLGLDVLRTATPRILADERVVVGPAGSCPPWARCYAVTGFRALAIGSHHGWATVDDLDVVHLSGQSRDVPDSATAIDPSTLPLASLRKLSPPALPSPTGAVSWTVAELLQDRQLQRQGTLIVEGWLVATPHLRCQAHPVPSGQLDFGCDEQDWLTDTEFQPWIRGSAIGPAEGIRVQNGSYRSFALDPARATGGGLVPRYGAYLVRRIGGDECKHVLQRSSALCSGPRGLIYEIVARIAE